MTSVKGFSKLSKEAKIEWIVNNYLDGDEKSIDFLKSYWNEDITVQKLHDEFIENTISNFYLPFGVAPNFKIDGKMYCIPMAIEESSVVAAAAKSANFWLDKGGFITAILGVEKIGHVHFIWNGKDSSKLFTFFESIKEKFYSETIHITKNMHMRGGGILNIELVDKTLEEPNYYQIKAIFDTCDSMGANFINSVLEEFSKILRNELENTNLLTADEKEVQIVMCILSNYTPNCLVRAEVKAKISDLSEREMSGEEFAEKFCRAIRIAEIEPYRATTHNKGIMNGIDSVVIATGNDFRAVEASAHTFASRSGKYTSLTHAEIKDGELRFWLDIPLALGTVGGLTGLHPMVKMSLKMLGNPNAQELMKITAVVGLAQNFSAIRSLVTSGIQKGHMKMHLLNILNQLEATESEKAEIVNYFKDKIVSHSAAVEIFFKIRGIEQPKVVKMNG
ncbi:MAG: hydroxymethylglutaryl-CoA reductase, degradative [Bacteroidetes bacterium]|nr:hydroxymethylglutaryl-CoA reductase, degradative [Bacteroidota bacterium]